MIITIDGPIATGKSTIAKRLAEKLGFIHFDTGAMYRCLTHGIIVNHIDPDNAQQLNAYLEHFSFKIEMDHGVQRYIVENEDVTDQIRGKAVTDLVSKISAISAVREKLIKLQREFALGVSAVFEGRDMGTTVFPKADLKFFLTGCNKTRAKRRFDELKKKFPVETEGLTLEETILDIDRRDTYDTTREISPLIQAKDAFVIDTTNLSLDEIIDKILEIKIEQRKE